MYKHIPKYVLHHSMIQHHLIKHGLNNAPRSLNDTWYILILINVLLYQRGLK